MTFSQKTYQFDKHFLICLEWGVVVFKSSHYFIISNFWNSTIQELVLFKSIYQGFMVCEYSLLIRQLLLALRLLTGKWGKYLTLYKCQSNNITMVQCITTLYKNHYPPMTCFEKSLRKSIFCKWSPNSNAL